MIDYHTGAIRTLLAISIPTVRKDGAFDVGLEGYVSPVHL